MPDLRDRLAKVRSTTRRAVEQRRGWVAAAEANDSADASHACAAYSRSKEQLLDQLEAMEADGSLPFLVDLMGLAEELEAPAGRDRAPAGEV